MFYQVYLTSLCRRRHWAEPVYETQHTRSGWTCRVQVNNREYTSDHICATEELSKDNTAATAYMICRNFSVNDGMYPGQRQGAHGITAGLPVAIGTVRRARYKPNYWASSPYDNDTSENISRNTSDSGYSTASTSSHKPSQVCHCRRSLISHCSRCADRVDDADVRSSLTPIARTQVFKDRYPSPDSSSISFSDIAPSVFSGRHSIKSTSILSSNTAYSEFGGSSIGLPPKEGPIRPTSPVLNLHAYPIREVDAKYACVSCNEKFTEQHVWEEHEYWEHEDQVDFICRACCLMFRTKSLALAHEGLVHESQAGTLTPKSWLQIQSARKRTAWGCGFCAESFQDWHSRCEHVATHYEGGIPRKEWDHSNEITGLLRQPEVYYAWHSLLREGYEASILPDDLKFRWSKDSTGRARSGSAFQLQDLLELGSQPRDIPSIVKLAYRLGCCGMVAVPAHTDQAEDSMSLALLGTPSNMDIAVMGPMGLMDPIKAGNDSNGAPSTSLAMEDESDALSRTLSNLSMESVCPSTPDSTEYDAAIPIVLEEWKRDLVDRLMLEFRSLLGQGSGFRDRGTGSDVSVSQGSTQSSAVSSSAISGSSRKRQREKNDPNGNGGDDEEEGSSRKGPKIAPEDKARLQGKLACPYYQRNPSRHQTCRSCAGPGWDTTHRLKEHLYRRHALPIRCSRCCTVFSTDLELTEHYRQTVVCEMKVLDLIEGFDKNQEKKMRSRKKTTATSEPEKWIELYKILFPDDDDDMLPSPYYDEMKTAERVRLHEFSQYEEYSRLELPRLVRRKLELQAQLSSSALEEQLRSALVDIVRDCQVVLSRSYRDTHLPQGEILQQPETTSVAIGTSMNPGNDVAELDETIDIAPYVAPTPVEIAISDNFAIPLRETHPSASASTISDSGYVSSLGQVNLNQNSMDCEDSRFSEQGNYVADGVDINSGFGAQENPVLLETLQGWGFSFDYDVQNSFVEGGFKPNGFN